MKTLVVIPGTRFVLQFAAVSQMVLTDPFHEALVPASRTRIVCVAVNALLARSVTVTVLLPVVRISIAFTKAWVPTSASVKVNGAGRTAAGSLEVNATVPL